VQETANTNAVRARAHLDTSRNDNSIDNSIARGRSPLAADDAEERRLTRILHCVGFLAFESVSPGNQRKGLIRVIRAVSASSVASSGVLRARQLLSSAKFITQSIHPATKNMACPEPEQAMEVTSM
jgi:hypothetical protein